MRELAYRTHLKCVARKRLGVRIPPEPLEVKMNRRTFLQRLAAVPVIGSLLPKTEKTLIWITVPVKSKSINLKGEHIGHEQMENIFAN